MKYSVLFVCMGNICRSPAAEGLFRARVLEADLQDRIECDSAGTIGFHTGDLPDARMRKAAKARGYTLESRARSVSTKDLHRFDELIAMDEQNLRDLQALQAKSDGTAKLSLIRDYCRTHGKGDVPDPYYGGTQGFEMVLDLLEDACSGLLEAIRSRLA
ncbi:MAG: hypothetical protein RL648_1824 [Verrucomicrobiota bacterium]